MTELNLEGMTTEELTQLIEAIKAERDRREYLANAPAILKELNQKSLAAEGIAFGEAWRQPTGAHDAYPEGWEVTLDGKQYISDLNGNVWKPGVSGWKPKQLPGEDAPAWTQPTGAHDAYKMGDKVVFDGKLYESLIDGNVWSPSGYPAGWKIATV